MQKVKNPGDIVFIIIFFILVNIYFAKLYFFNIVDLYNDEYNYDGIRFLFPILGLELVMIILFIWSRVYDLDRSVSLMIVIGGLAHWFTVTIGVEFIPVCGLVVSLLQIVVAIFISIRLVQNKN